MARMFCARCGKPYDGKTVFIGSLCLDCFLETNKLLCIPNRIDFQYCKYCGSIRIGYRWVPGGELEEAVPAYLKTFLESSIKPCLDIVRRVELKEITPLTQISWRTLFNVTYLIELKNVETLVEQSYRIEVRAIPSICPSCHLARGGDYNVLVQIRGKLTPEIGHILSSKLDELGAKVIDVKEQHKGIDVFLEDRSAASRLLRELRKHVRRLKVKYTAEDVGVSSTGRLRKRLVLSVRIG